MAAATMIKCSIVPSGFNKSALAGTRVQGLGLNSLPAPLRSTRPLKVQANVKKIKVDEPLGPSGDTKFRDGKDASGRVAKGKGVYQFVNKYGANVDGYSPIYDPKDWSPSGDVYAGGKTGLLIWAVTLAGVLAVGAFLVYNTSALAG
uniref:Photosystem II 10 kDa polypeptide, chloroplastic n=1 Tax=Araucaria cunninghamii TaxID=56994 RepID=A0A0D6R5G6_ARACU